MESGRPTAVVAQEYAKLYPQYNIDVPLGGAYPDGHPVAGVFDPSGTIDFTSPVTAAPGYIKRYGHGMARPILQDLKALPSISIVPDPEHNLLKTKGEEGQEFPNDHTLAILNMAYPAAGIDLQDYQFLWNFSEYVIGPLNRRLPIGTPRSQWPVPQQQVQPQQVTQQTQQPMQQQQTQQTQQTTTPTSQPVPAALDLQSTLSNILNQVLPGLIAVEVARALPKGVDPSTVIPDTSSLQSQLNAANQTINAISSALQGVTIPTSGGGRPMNALRKIASLVGPVTAR